LYAGYIGNRKYVSLTEVLDHKYRVTEILPNCLT